VFYVKVGTFDQFEQSTVNDAPFISVGIVTLIVRYNTIVSVYIM